MMFIPTEEFTGINISTRSKAQLVRCFHFVMQALSVTGNVYYLKL